MRLFALAAAFVALAVPAMAQTFDTPEALLEAFYEPYFTGEFYEDETPFRSEALQALYDRDADNTPDGEMGALSFDPFIDGQDFDIKAFSIDAVAIEGDIATAGVSFTNFGEPRQLVYDLVFEDGGWRIDDVASVTPGNEYRLSEIFADAAGEHAAQ
jgi:hypothetical protein